MVIDIVDNSDLIQFIGNVVYIFFGRIKKLFLSTVKDRTTQLFVDTTIKLIATTINFFIY